MPLVKKSNLYLFLITLLIAGSLININTFGPPTLSAYFFYTIIGSLVAVIAGISLIKNKQPIQIANPLPILALTLLAGYYIINGWVNGNGGINLRHYIILTDAVLLISFCTLLSKGTINLLSVSKIITIISIIESLICILQYFSIIPSLDTLFKVTGSNENPNVTAMFLAMAVPALLVVLFRGDAASPDRSKRPVRTKKWIILSATSIILSLTALILLQCRTAFIGATVGSVLIVNHQFQLLNKLQTKFSKPVLIITAIISITLIILALTLLYHSKQASSDGRLFIWKISMQAIAEKPILGSGYGQFEHDYNLAQAHYFATGKATQQEIYNASYVHMSYNEFLENLFEGGIIGLVLFVGLLVALLTPCPLKGVLGSITAKEGSQKAVLGSSSKIARPTENIEPSHKSPFRGEGFFAYAGITTFTIMCFFNFTVQALPVRALFILYAAVCCVYNPIGSTTFQKLTLARTRLLNGTPFRVGVNSTSFKIGVTALSFFLMLKLLTLSKAYHQCETIVDNSDNLTVTEASDELAMLQKDLNLSSYFWRSYGNTLAKANNNDAALQSFKNAIMFSSNPNVYIEMANCYGSIGKYKEAIDAITVAKNIEPHHFAPLYALMKIYHSAKDTENAQRVANEIIVMQPKVASDKVVFYKNEAKKLIDN
jgi:O-antigen ligase